MNRWEKLSSLFQKLTNRVWNFILTIWDLGMSYQNRQGPFISAGVCFYVILGIFPLLLFTLTFLGELLGYRYVGDNLLRFVQIGFPQMGDSLFENLKEIMSYRLHGQTFTRILSLATLGLSSISLIDAGLKGLYQLTGLKHLKKPWYHPRHIVAMALLVAFFMGLLLIPVVIIFLINLAADELNALGRLSYLPGFLIFQKIFNWINLVGKVELLARANFFHGTVAFIFLAIMFRWIFKQIPSWRDCFRGGAVFVFLFVAGKSFHYLYLFYAQNNLNRNYGGFTHLIVAILWMYYLINSFYLSAMVTVRKIGHNRTHD